MAKGELARAEERIAAIYSRAKKNILGELTRAANSSYNEARVQEARRKLQTFINALNAASTKEASKTIAAAYAKEAATTMVQVEILGFRRPRRETRPAGGELIEGISRTRKYLSDANSTIKKSIDNFFAALLVASVAISRIQEFDDEERAAFVGEVEEAARTAVASAWSRRRLQSMIVDKLFKLVESGDLITINGRNFDIVKYAKMVVRTEFRKAQTAASIETCDRYGCDLVLWSQHANACELCRPHEDQVFSLSGKDPVFPPLGDLRPPLHPNCGHSILATSRQAIAARKEFG